MENLTLETLPKAFSLLTQEVGEIKRLLLEQGTPKETEADHWFDLSELCQYHPDKPRKATVYGWVCTGLIPVHKSGKKLRFLKSEIDSWLKQGRKKTLGEAASEAEAYLKRKGGSHV
jgi:excisionase family DNA binding protein